MTTLRPFPFVAATLAMAVAMASVHAAPAGTATDSPATSSEKVVEYAALEHRVGDEIIVETTLGTARRGILVKYTRPGLTLQLGPENGSIDLSIPRETVRSIRIIKATSAAPQADTTQQQGRQSAQKN